MSPPELVELTSCFYSCKMHIASEELEDAGNLQFAESELAGNRHYLMKRVSRSWSRLTKDFIVRKRLKRS
jgi:hypothetical protein